MNLKWEIHKKHRLKRVALLLGLLMLLSGCGKKENGGKTSSPAQAMRDPATGEYAPMENATALTGIYHPTEVYRYDGEVLNAATVPLYDPESGKLTTFSKKTVETPATDANGNPLYFGGSPVVFESSVTTLRTILPDGECAASIPLPMPDGHEFHHGRVTETGVWYLTYRSASDGAKDFTFHRMNSDGSDHRSAPVRDLFGNPTNDSGMFNLNAALFPDGTTIAAIGNELAVLDEALNRRYSVASDGAVLSLSDAWEDGCCLFLAGKAPDRKIWKLGADQKQPELFADLKDMPVQVIFGPGADYYLYDSDGIHAVTGEDSVLVLNRQNSAISGTAYLIGAVAPYVFMFHDTAGTAENEDGITLYRRADDVDLSSVKVIEVANAMFGTNRDIEEKITKFNREHPEIRVVLTDVLDDSESTDTIFDRVCFNIGNGFYKPDIVLANNGKKIVDLMIEKKLYRDLTPYLENDPEVRLDDLFGMVRSYFTDGDGGLWGISPTFCVRALTGRSDVLGQTARKVSWTLDEALGYLESRPKGTVGIENLTQENWTSFLLGPAGFGRWIDYDAGTCHFDRPDFERMLRYLKTLPKDNDEFMRRASFWAGMSADEQYGDYAPYRDGTIALQNAWYQGVYGVCELKDCFGTTEKDSPDLVCVGFPSDNGNDALQFVTQSVCIITSFCSDPDAAWELIRTFFDDPVGYGGNSGNLLAVLFSDVFPSLKSAYDRHGEFFKQHYLIETYGNTEIKQRKEDSIPTAPANGRVIVFEQEYLDMIRSLLDGAACSPYINYTPAEITDIIFEEVSAYLAGGADEDRCVKNIQSRVGIWLAEHE